jgi:hypothetical protein
MKKNEIVKKIKKLRSDGLTYSAIAKEMMMTSGKVYSYYHDNIINKKKKNDKNWTTIKCECCGKSYTIYKLKFSKYCSRVCYLKKVQKNGIIR